MGSGAGLCESCDWLADCEDGDEAAPWCELREAEVDPSDGCGEWGPSPVWASHVVEGSLDEGWD